MSQLRAPKRVDAEGRGAGGVQSRHAGKHRRIRNLVHKALFECSRRIGDRTGVERRYYISSLPADAEKFMRAVRSHWEVENRLHWCLDVQFGDDYARARTGH